MFTEDNPRFVKKKIESFDLKISTGNNDRNGYIIYCDKKAPYRNE